MNQVQIPLKLTGIGAIKAELKALKGQIADATDPEVIAKLSQKAGELADKLKDVNEQVSVFNTGSKFEAVSNSFGLIQADLASLDFEGASEKAQTFAKTLGSVGKPEITGAIKGLGGVIKNVGGAFVKLGVQILANPIFLLAAVITAIVVAVVAFLNKIGVIDKIFKAINAALKPLIDGFKQLTEWLGLSTAASDDAAEKVKANNEKIVESSKKRAEIQGKAIDQEIQLAQSLGKETTDLEIEKTKVTEREAKKRLAQAQKDLKELGDKRGNLAEEERKRLKKQLEDETALIKQAQVDRKVILNKEAQEAKQKAAEDAKKAAEDAKQRAIDAAKKYKEGKAEIQKEIAAANKIVTDSTKTQTQIEIDDVKAKYAALIKQANKYKQDTTALKAAEQVEIDAINKAVADAELARQKEIQQTITENRNAQLQREEDFQEQYRQLVMSDKDRELDEVQTRYFELIALAEQYGLDTSALIEKQKKEQAEINKKYDEQEKQARLESIEKAKAERDAKLTLASDIVNGVSDLGNAFIKDQKKLENFNKASALIQIGIDTAKAISALVAASQSNPLNGVTGGIAGITQFASGILQITTNIAKAKQLLSSPSSSVSGGGSSGGGSSSTSAAALTPSLSLFGQGNNLNTASQTQPVTTNQNIVVQAVVSETDITNTQNKINKIKKGSEL